MFSVISCMQNNKFWKGFGASLRVGGLTTICWEEENPFDFQRTSLAGLAPDLATSSGPLCNAGPHPGTTWSYKAGEAIHQLIEQPEHAPGSCTIWRQETQNSAFVRYPLHDHFLQDPPH
ncbi:hypothetical protein TNCV_4572441 [Trichonephila clavipes]|nr:hypothetical protein TNCV_4572441 [Trichonephila clavipes]